jgi:RsiW-degrading membrane proteinase PrsW (M82 family)
MELIFVLGLGIALVWFTMTKSRQSEKDKRIDFVIGVLLIGGVIGFLLAS